jgi:hypothetical protein
VSFSTSKNTAVVNVLLPADKIGSQVLKQPLVHLKRKKAYIQKTSLLIDQRQMLLLLSILSDIGALKRSIESAA